LGGINPKEYEREQGFFGTFGSKLTALSKGFPKGKEPRKGPKWDGFFRTWWVEGGPELEE